ncbi:MAG: tetratricopeptide repeat protein [Pirellula sp.]|jgi:tetratricopeptide (TPR) repeat protein|nr:tetratricopeptide repeat protein [Pirellula sp.]
MAENNVESTRFLQNKRVALAGKLGALSKKEAFRLLREFGAEPVDRISEDVDCIVIGADELPGEDISRFLDHTIRKRLRDGSTSLIHENDLLLKLGIAEDTPKQQYTPAMMAEIIRTPVRNIRRWHRMGLLQSIRIVRKLPYFDFEQIQNARQISAWINKGARPADIVKQLSHFKPWVEKKSLLDLDLVVDGRRLLLRQGGKLLGAHGQLHLDFDTEEFHPVSDDTLPIVLAAQPDSIPETESHAELGSPPNDLDGWTRDDLLRSAEELEDSGQLDEAIEWYRVILARYGSHPEICFQLAELLYRIGDVSAARERYYNVIELDEDFIEARANLGCVLAETGRVDLAIAAFEGALNRDDRYPDLHYHIARCLDEIGEADRAALHWLRFIQLAPQSPWAEEALDRLGAL